MVSSVEKTQYGVVRQATQTVSKPVTKKIDIGGEINGVKIDGKIGDFQQGGKGTCVLLSMLLGLKNQAWGQEAFSKACVSDGEGGAVVTIYPNSYDYTAKTFHITNEELLNAKNQEIGKISPEDAEALNNLDWSKPQEATAKRRQILEKYYHNTYSKGDDDVLAIELAVEKHVREEYGTKLFSNEPNEDVLKDPLNSPEYHRNRLNHGLITGDGTNRGFHHPYDGDSPYVWQYYSESDKNNILNYLEKNMGDKQITAYITFKENVSINSDIDFEKNSLTEDIGIKRNGDIYGEYVIKNHAYNLKRIETIGNVKFVVFENPHESKDELKLPYNKVLKHSSNILVSAKDEIHSEIFKICDNNVNEDLNNNLDEYIKKEEQQIVDNFAQKVYENLLAKLKEVPKEERINIINEFFNTFNFIDYRSQYADTALIMTNVLLNNLEEFVTTLDNMEYGWGHGQAKKDLIKPFIDTIMARIQKEHELTGYSGESFYKEYADKCIEELDATFYTDSDVIVENLRKLLEKCKSDFEYDMKHFN